jgi:hypothetical protein
MYYSLFIHLVLFILGVYFLIDGLINFNNGGFSVGLKITFGIIFMMIGWHIT